MAQKAQEIGRDALFREFFKREPTREELQRFDRLESLMGVPRDDSLWFYVLLQEFYDDRQKKRLEEIERVSDDAAAKALEVIAASVVKKADELAAEKERGFIWRSLALFMTPVVLLGAMTFSAGYVMGSGSYPFWIRPRNTLQAILGWFLNVPSGWILLMGCTPYTYEVYTKCVKEINNVRRSGGKVSKEVLILYGKTLACFVALCLVALVVLFLTGLDFVFERFSFSLS